jgi:hypothetical protein
MEMGWYDYGPCGAAIAGGLYTLNCESAAAAGGGGADAGCGTALAAVGVAAVVVCSVLEDAWSTFGAVDARFG